MISSLVGDTGFVGSNIAAKNLFTNLYHSKNIEESYGTNPDLLVYAGIRAEKYLANANPQEDRMHIHTALKNIEMIRPNQLILISTIDVYRNPYKVDEDEQIVESDLMPYGRNRYYLETKVREIYPNALIVRLPGLFGINIKKNFIYDMLNTIPTMLNKEKFEELNAQASIVGKYYKYSDNGFYKCISMSEVEKKELKDKFTQVGFSSINFTDSRSQFQFYNLALLWGHIKIALQHNIKLINMATEPIKANELYFYLTGKDFCNEFSNTVFNYDFRTKHAEVYEGANGYILNKHVVMEQVKKFMEEYRS